jgi:hypothetical protein
MVMAKKAKVIASNHSKSVSFAKLSLYLSDEIKYNGASDKSELMKGNYI